MQPEYCFILSSVLYINISVCFMSKGGEKREKERKSRRHNRRHSVPAFRPGAAYDQSVHHEYAGLFLCHRPASQSQPDPHFVCGNRHFSLHPQAKGGGAGAGCRHLSLLLFPGERIQSLLPQLHGNLRPAGSGAWASCLSAFGIRSIFSRCWPLRCWAFSWSAARAVCSGSCPPPWPRYPA